MADNQPSEAVVPTSSQSEIPSPTLEQLKGETPKEPIRWPWEQEIPADYKEAKLWENFKGKSGGEILKSYAEAQSLLGRSVQLPKDGDDAEGWSKIYKTLGRPEDKKGYEWTPPEISGHEWKDDELDAFKDLAWKLGLNQTQTKGLLDWNAAALMNETQLSNQADTKIVEETKQKLQAEYGDNFKTNDALVDLYLQQKCPESAENMKAMANADVNMFKWLVNEAQVMREAGSFGKVTPGDFGGVSPDSAKNKIKEILSIPRDEQKDHPYYNEKHPMHWEAVQEVLGWQKIAKASRAS